MSGAKDILQSVGAVGGFAAVVGLAVLAMLYFSQARDVRRLREWAGREPERAQEVELRAQQIASQAIAQAYESMAMRQSEAQAAAGIAQDQGVQVDAPLTAESQPVESIPVPEGTPPIPQETQAHDVVSEEFGGVSADDEEAVLPAEDAEDHLEAAEHDAEHHAEPGSENGDGGETVVHPAPAEAAGAGEAQSLLQPSTPAAARAAAPLPPLPPLDTAEFRPARPPSPSIPDYYLSTEATGSGHFEAVEPPPSGRSRVPFAVAGVLVAVFAVILIATQLLGGSDNKTKTPTKTANSQTQNTAPRNEKVNRAAVTVSVLNGTGTAGLANNAALGLNQAGFTDTTTGNLNDGTQHPTTTVYYDKGSKLEASEVAKELKVPTANLKPATSAILASGGSVPVIVVLGADFDQ